MLSRKLLKGVVCLILLACMVAGSVAVYRYLTRKPRVVRLTVPLVRTTAEMAGRLGQVLDADSADFMEVMTDSVLIDSLGYDRATLPAMFIPNTYEVYQWTSPKNLLLRLKQECDNFWTTERLLQAEAQDLSPVEVMTLASIVEQETACDDERARVAGMYLNRLERQMPLQADPTVKFALGDFALKRIQRTHLQCDSPYNTYRHTGLPPGPICIPSLASIKAVLKPEIHNYIYMCAKEDFCGRHNFAETYGEHIRNARRYARALDKAGIN
ncbi:MAG: endolytic transglycosylase MltG [Bacteroidaceae bacterium]|nr:endolytic transglycosylase MltG [Bacteroidaceae bacterium]